MQIIHSGELINNNIEEVYGPSKVLNPLFNSMNKELRINKRRYIKN